MMIRELIADVRANDVLEMRFDFNIIAKRSTCSFLQVKTSRSEDC